jgi:SAM-dependent methyltransferase
LPKDLIFDQPHARRFVEARQDWLRKVLPELKQARNLQTAIDVGCGVGPFSGFLRELGFQVVGVDGRKQNVEEARRRRPELEFHCLDVQDRALQELGSFDLVFCFGLLYHLENPLLAFRNFAALAREVMLVEAICVPGNQPYFLLRDEPSFEDQSLTPLALYPSESALIKAAYRVGFQFVWQVTSFPEHEDFVETPNRKRFRTIFAASRVPLKSSFFEFSAEPQENFDPWLTRRAEINHRIAGFARLPWRDKLRVLHRKLSLS